MGELSWSSKVWLINIKDNDTLYILLNWLCYQSWLSKTCLTCAVYTVWVACEHKPHTQTLYIYMIVCFFFHVTQHRYAQIAQENGLVPIVEPEVMLYDNNNNIYILFRYTDCNVHGQTLCRLLHIWLSCCDHASTDPALLCTVVVVLYDNR
jgi:hypothetical protein